MFQKYRPVVPDEFQLDDLYAEPSAEVYSKVKKETIDRLEFRKKLKATKYANDMERINNVNCDKV